MSKRVHFANKESLGESHPPKNRSKEAEFQSQETVSPPHLVTSEQAPSFVHNPTQSGDLSIVAAIEKFESLPQRNNDQSSGHHSKVADDRPAAESSQFLDEETCSNLSLFLFLQEYWQLQEANRAQNATTWDACACTVCPVEEDIQFGPITCSHSPLRFASDISGAEEHLKRKKCNNNKQDESNNNANTVQNRILGFLLNLFRRK